ncbi:hypothetical protein N7532_007464 [Penicillium argentinense]|uniref:Uncharacterized protein n=1 Tax=Penicillium argentinense TaxID=1131581 RepID=A0A9W9K6P4_9EURO|nr:uncharacterized protein N7532_007464 [Penicillium argentinense]KAJ5095173.1 hypothetical protein N7532_007464 [Penicillium argentinense]
MVVCIPTLFRHRLPLCPFDSTSLSFEPTNSRTWTGIAEDLTNVEEVKATDRLIVLVGLLLEATSHDDVHLHAIALVSKLTPGSHQIEDLHGHEVAHPLTTADAHEHLPSNLEVTAKVRMGGGDPRREGSLREEMTESDHLLHHGDRGRLTAKEGLAMRPEGAAVHVVLGIRLQVTKI